MRTYTHTSLENTHTSFSPLLKLTRGFAARRIAIMRRCLSEVEKTTAKPKELLICIIHLQQKNN